MRLFQTTYIKANESAKSIKYSAESAEQFLDGMKKQEYVTFDASFFSYLPKAKYDVVRQYCDEHEVYYRFLGSEGTEAAFLIINDETVVNNEKLGWKRFTLPTYEEMVCSKFHINPNDIELDIFADVLAASDEEVTSLGDVLTVDKVANEEEVRQLAILAIAFVLRFNRPQNNWGLLIDEDYLGDIDNYRYFIFDSDAFEVDAIGHIHDIEEEKLWAEMNA